MGAGRLGRNRPAGLLRGRAPTGWLHNVARSADPAGARRQVDQALPWNLNGRLAHHWLRHANQTVSTLDLLSDGLTLLTGPGEPSRRQAAATLNTPAPVTTHALDVPSAPSIGIQPGGAQSPAGRIGLLVAVLPGSPGDAFGGGFGRLADGSGIAGSRRAGWAGGFR